MHRLTRLLIATLVLTGCAAATQAPADPYTAAVETLQFQALGPTYTAKQIDTILEGRLRRLSESQRRAAATLVSIGAIKVADLTSPARVQHKLNDYLDVMTTNHPALLGRIGDAALLSRLTQPLSYEHLLAATDVIDALGIALADGVITGYDLRLGGIYDNFPAAQTLIYSHSELLHVRQLITVLDREGVSAWVYLTPKISAFLHREEWGDGGNNLVTLSDGTRVVQGREMAVLFRFPTPADRLRFHNVVIKYAKRDSEDETGLIANAWWQPFYYSDSELAEFKAISLVVLNANQYEATLTVVEEKAQTVIDALQQNTWPLRHDRVWVNPAFYRFLNGDFK